jgi:molecular chaperone DnaJ
MSRDYYDILGVSKNASQDEIKRAFRKLAHQYHPDKATGDAEKFKEINKAYQTLSDEKKRSQYDQFGHSAYEQMGGASGGQGSGFSGFSGFAGAQGFNFNDLGDIFGQAFGFGGERTERRGSKRGQHIEMDLTLTFEEAAFGVEKIINPYKVVVCGDCEGTGAQKGSKLVKCGNCQGAGQIKTVQQTILGSFQAVRNCARCDGEGRVPEKVCGTCAGSGVDKKAKRIEVKIPAGIDNGEVLRVSGEGEVVKGGRAGDLYLHIRVKPHVKFERDGFDVHSEEEISFSRAALGAKIEISTLDGAVTLKIPAGTQPGTIFRLKGKGIFHLRSTGRGDHFVTIKVKVPTKLTRQQKKALEEWE